MHLEQTYILRQTYLENLDNYQFKFNAIDGQTSSEKITQYVKEALAKPVQNKLTSDIHSLHEQLEYIVYLNKLSYYHASNINLYNLFNFYTPILQLKKMALLIEEKQILFSDGLQIFIASLSQEDEAAENLIKYEIEYLDTVCASDLSSKVEKSNQSFQIIDIEKMKSQSDKYRKKLQEALNKYAERCDKEKGNQYKTPYSPTENATIPELKNDSFEEQEKNSPPDSGNYSDDDSNKSFYSAIEELELTIDQETLSQPTVCTEEQNKLTIHTENQEQNPSNKNNLLAKLWNLLIRIWQHIESIFKLFKKSNDLVYAEIPKPSHPTPQQSTFEQNILPIATETKKLVSTTCTSVLQPLFANKKPTAMSKQTNARTAERVINYLPKFSKLN